MHALTVREGLTRIAVFSVLVALGASVSLPSVIGLLSVAPWVVLLLDVPLGVTGPAFERQAVHVFARWGGVCGCAHLVNALLGPFPVTESTGLQIGLGSLLLALSMGIAWRSRVPLLDALGSIVMIPTLSLLSVVVLLQLLRTSTGFSRELIGATSWVVIDTVLRLHVLGWNARGASPDAAR